MEEIIYGIKQCSTFTNHIFEIAQYFTYYLPISFCKW